MKEQVEVTKQSASPSASATCRYQMISVINTWYLKNVAFKLYARHQSRIDYGL